MLKLAKTDAVITAYAEGASGPGWANSPIWVIIRSQLDGSLRHECLQPDEQSREMRILWGVSQCAHATMTYAVARYLKGRT